MVLIMYGILPNRYMDDVVLGKMSAQLPDETGDFGNKVSHGTVVVMILSSRSNQYALFLLPLLLKKVSNFSFSLFANSPLGILYPQYQSISKYFNKMHEEAEKNRKEYTCKYIILR
jgi:hypothetical protein